MSDIWVELAYRWDEVDRFPMSSPDRVVLIPARGSEMDAGFLKMYFFDEDEARKYARDNGFRIVNDSDFDFKTEKALYLFNKGVEEYKEASNGRMPYKIRMSKAASEALKDYIDFRDESALGFDVEIVVEEAYSPDQIWVDCTCQIF